MSRYGGWIQTYTGRVFYPLDPRPEDLDIEDIAHALAHTNRWNGHTIEAFSVAQHSVYVSHAVRHPEAALWGLMHDASEAYLQDIARPVKGYLGPYREYEDQLAGVIIETFRIPMDPSIERSVQEVDTAMLFAERDVLFRSPPPQDYEIEELNTGLKLVDIDPAFHCWRPEEAKQAFLTRFNKLMSRKAA